ncbi:MAG: hypothetical protein QN141_04265 [Armatimonadota bacterium]|nr:hypothetical protein [Armatimonadota bacterium]MDR7450578.1 hypothetical protein [Armatimonadota bacterium]MDR7466289.1 hypothetical protein [Armatimonadota bacterium]MDR7493010.1 hypothetical protein [Armatimonadota bacterium]MDR7498233.1 hypothetical protein [Armatimonadota bacterium]
MVLFVLVNCLIVLPLTWMSLRWLGVPDRHELVAGIFLTIVYALFASTLFGIFSG